MLKEATPVKIRILSTTKDATGYLPTTEQKYLGKMLEKNGKYYVMYTETGEEAFQGTKTTIKWDANRVLILRSGALEHRQEFCRGEEFASMYKTPYLEIPIKTTTHYLYTYQRQGVWHLELDYTLAQDGAVYGEMKVLIEISGMDA